ncbi:hypothetical protein GJAV_G00182750 [Gymnothorax javanicus]|nr:hypothetical protein GJAV_G00182750 [Gymnothorax javanicus]
MNGGGKTMRLREWLIAQIDSGEYAGLNWENEERTMFRIPWKHAAKQDYKQDEDAALFKAWAVYKGKFREGRDKADPSTWKTRLRCALNKSPDFREVPERGQLDVSEPYKVYHIKAEGGSAMVYAAPPKTYQSSQPVTCFSVPARLHPQYKKLCDVQTNSGDERERKDFNGHTMCVVHLSTPTQTQRPSANSGESRKAETILWPKSTADAAVSPYCIIPATHLSSSRIAACTSTVDGCWILQGSVPVENERIYGPCTAEQVRFPSPRQALVSPVVAEAMDRLLPHLERGVLLWVAPDGVFAKRFCQGRVYWVGPLAPHRDKPNKLEREKTCKLLDMPIFLKELQEYLHGGGPKPRFEIDLCFGEEFPVSNQNKEEKLITAQVEPLFARNMLPTMGRPEMVDGSSVGGRAVQLGAPGPGAATAEAPAPQKKNTALAENTGRVTEQVRERREEGKDGQMDMV